MVSWILTIWVAGSLFIAVLAQALGSDVSFSQVPRCGVRPPVHIPVQTLGVIGYSLLPLLVCAVLLSVLGAVPLMDPLLKARHRRIVCTHARRCSA